MIFGYNIATDARMNFNIFNRALVAMAIKILFKFYSINIKITGYDNKRDR